MSDLNDLRKMIQALVAAIPGKVDSKKVGKTAAWDHVLSDEKTTELVAEDWCAEVAARASRKPSNGQRERFPNGKGEYVPLGELTLFAVRDYALSVRAGGQTQVRLANELLAVISAAIKRSGGQDQLIGASLSSAEIDQLRELARSAKVA